MLHMQMDLSTAPVETWAAVASRLESLGLTATTLAQEVTRDGERAVQRAYTCHNECRKRQPSVALRLEPIPFFVWRESVCTSPDAYFIAKREDEYVAVSMLERVAGRPSVLQSGFTGTLAPWSRKGAAKALKACGLLYALGQGCQQIEASNLQINSAMVAINISLGFRVIGRHLHAYPIPLPASG